MSLDFEPYPPQQKVVPVSGALGAATSLVAALNRWIMRLGMLALLASAAILTYSVFSRYFFKASTNWQDEAAVFCLVGATFLCGSYVQSFRGHIGIEAVAGYLSPRVNHFRLLCIDILSALFCIFFAWKSWTLWHEAWAEGQTTSSSWAPPLWVPYALMAAGITLLALQIVLQVAARIMPAQEAA
ncbi:MAG: TRAP transporter small permease [Nitrosomonadales bacterium]|nr:TRAP transporter small permease [Nitrosomonadales bacterium]